MYCNRCGLGLRAGQGVCPRCGYVLGMQALPGPYGPGYPGSQYGPAYGPVYGPAYGNPGYQGYYGLRPAAPVQVVERRVNAVALGWYIYAGLAALSGILGLTFAHAILGGHMGAFGHGPYGGGFRFGHPRTAFGMPFFFLHYAWVGLALRVGLAFAAGWGLMRKAPWGRGVALVAACLSLFHPPLGTALGIWTLVVLLSASNAAGYRAMVRG